MASKLKHLRDRFIDRAYARISKIKPLIPMSNQPKVTGASYHPLWRQISANWVSMNGNPHTVSLCLETVWNHKNSTTTGYRAVGANLAAATEARPRATSSTCSGTRRGDGGVSPWAPHVGRARLES